MVNFKVPANWTLFEGEANNGIYQSINWSGERVYNLVIDGIYKTSGYEEAMAELRSKTLGDFKVTLQDLRDRLTIHNDKDTF